MVIVKRKQCWLLGDRLRAAITHQDLLPDEESKHCTVCFMTSPFTCETGWSLFSERSLVRKMCFWTMNWRKDSIYSSKKSCSIYSLYVTSREKKTEDSKFITNLLLLQIMCPYNVNILITFYSCIKCAAWGYSSCLLQIAVRVSTNKVNMTRFRFTLQYFLLFVT